MKRIWGLAVIGTAAGAVATVWRFARRMTAEANIPPENSTEFSLKDWKQALAAVRHALSSKNLPILAAGVAYYSTLAFFPLMAAAVAIAALIITPEQLHTVAETIEKYLPGDVAKLITTQLDALTGRRATSAVAAAIAIAVSIFGASGASKSLVSAANLAYGVKESRGWIKQQIRGIIWTVGGIIFGFAVAILLVINKTIFYNLGVFSPLADTMLYARWAIIILLMAMGLAVFYRYGPNRKNPRWQWISWGALFATILWLAGTALFFVYVQNFGHYGRSYSFFAGIIILMIWLNLSAFTVLLGAAVNHGLETAADRTGQPSH